MLLQRLNAGATRKAAVWQCANTCQQRIILPTKEGWVMGTRTFPDANKKSCSISRSPDRHHSLEVGSRGSEGKSAVQSSILP